MNRTIPVSQPVLGDAEFRYVNDALAKGAISGHFGTYLAKFEQGFAAYCDCAHGIATSGGTTAIHLALATLRISKDDEVLVSTLTNMASVFAILYQGAKPVPIDIEPDTLNMNAALLEGKVTPRTKAILAVHLFGHPVDMDPVLAVARKHRLAVVEDCAEAHGATYNGRKVGALGNLGCFSFYANKILTTGEGGMVTTNDPALAARAQSLKALAFGEKNKFQHQDIGFNYRMTNLQAALGCAQLERVEEIIEKKRRIALRYGEQLGSIERLRLPVEKSYARNVYWMYHVVLEGGAAGRRAEVMQGLTERGIETREGFVPANLQEIFIRDGWTHPDDCPNARDIAHRGFYVPSGPELSETDQDYVVTHLKALVEAL